MELMNDAPTSDRDAQSASNPLTAWLSGRVRLNWEFWVFFAIFLLALFTRFYMLGDRTMSHDESLHTKFSWDLYSNGSFQHTPLMHGPILFHMTALSYFLFGDNDFTARLYPAVLGVLMVMFPLLFRRWLGRWGAILASVMFLISPLVLYYNRYIREDTPSIFYTLVMVYCTFMYLNGPTVVRRKARWLYIFSAALLASMATKEVSFMYIAIFGSILTLYWLARMGQTFFRLPGRTLFYFVSIAGLLGGIVALGMYVVLSIVPLETTLPLGNGSVEFQALITWTLLVIVGVALLGAVSLWWAFRRSKVRKPLLELLLLLLLMVVFASLFVFVEERSHVTTDAASSTSVPTVPGQEGAAVVGSTYAAWPLYGFWALCIGVIVALIYSARAGWWRKLHRFPEFDILLLMATLVLPWATPFVMKMMNASPMSMPQIAAAVQAALPFVQFDLSQYGVQIALSAVPVIPAILVGTVAGLIWDRKRWLISAAIFYVLFVFFFTTVFTNINGIGTGMIGSLGYWLEQQAVRRGNQPQYYYMLLVLPFYEFLPIIGSVLAMLTGLTAFWRFRRQRLEEVLPAPEDVLMDTEDGSPDLIREPLPEDADVVLAVEPPEPESLRNSTEWLRAAPFLIFTAWWAVFNMVAYTLAGEKMPWLGTHMTTPMIFLAAWYFGRYLDRIDRAVFFKRGWQYLLLLPLLFVALAQVAAPLVFGSVGGLETAQLTRTFQWFGGIVIAALVGYAIWRQVASSGWAQFRVMVMAAVFFGLAFLTFRSAWMASYINYDLATEYLVYAHGAPANKRVTEELEALSKRITGGMDLKFAYDFKISWPGAWYFRNFKNAVFLGETPSPRSMEDALVVIVGDENRASVEGMLEDRYYRFDYPRMWWPMQDYFGLTAQRVNDFFDFSGQNPQSAQVRQGVFDIWWSRDYTTYGQAFGRDFSLTQWPVRDSMYVFVRKDIAAQMWTLGVGNGSAASPVAGVDVNQCTANWEARPADLVFDSAAADLLNHPRAVAVAPNGMVYTAEEFSHRISVYNPDGSFAFNFGSEGAEPGQFERPSGIAIGQSGNVYVADTWNYRVQVFTPQGEYITGWGQRGEFGAAAPAQPLDAFWGPRSVAVDSDERVYVSDTGNKRVRVYTKDGAYIRDIGGAGSGVGQLDEPAGLAITTSGLLYVADTWNRRVSVFTLDGQPASMFTASDGTVSNSFRVRGWADDLGNRPYLAVDAVLNLIYITDPDAGRVLIYDTLGKCVGSFGQLSREAAPDLTQFSSVGGLGLDSVGNLIVSDAGAGRLLRFAPYQVPPPVVEDANVQPESTAEATVELVAPVGLEVTGEVIGPIEGIEMTPESTPAG